MCDSGPSWVVLGGLFSHWVVLFGKRAVSSCLKACQLTWGALSFSMRIRCMVCLEGCVWVLLSRGPE